MGLVAFTFRGYFTGFGGDGMVHSRNEYLPRSLPSSASRLVLPPSSEKITSRMPYPPSKAIPFTVVAVSALICAPSTRLVMKERTLKRVIGTLLAGFVPGSTQPHSLAGIR